MVSLIPVQTAVSPLSVPHPNIPIRCGSVMLPFIALKFQGASQGFQGQSHSWPCVATVSFCASVHFIFYSHIQLLLVAEAHCILLSLTQKALPSPPSCPCHSSGFIFKVHSKGLPEPLKLNLDLAPVYSPPVQACIALISQCWNHQLTSSYCRI